MLEDKLKHDIEFLSRSQICEKRLLASSYLSVRLEHLGSHRTDIHEISYWSLFPKSVDNIHVLLKSVENNGTLHEDQGTFMIISR
jgi:hypothetical protein